MKKKGLTENTSEVFETVSQMNCIKDLYLCGGTGLSLQLDHRLSEDLDFELLGTRKERPDLQYAEIVQEIKETFKGSELEMLGDDHFQIYLPNKTKLSFYRPEDSVPTLHEGYRHNNIVTPTLQELLGMKIYATTVRNVFRDYYDIYALLESGCSLKEGLEYALTFARHKVHTKDILSCLITPGLFPKEADFDGRLKPKYNVTPEIISKRIKEEIEKIALSPKKKRQISVVKSKIGH